MDTLDRGCGQRPGIDRGDVLLQMLWIAGSGQDNVYARRVTAEAVGAVDDVLRPAFADDEEQTPAIGDVLSSGRERILVVDDDDAVRRATERALVSRGYSVLVARGSHEALSLAGEAFDAVVVDLIMPGMGGDTLVERLRDRRADLPAVLLTGYGRKGVELTRPFRLLRKPASPEELARAVRAVIDEAAVGRRDGSM